METDRARFACGAFGRGANIAMIRVILPPNLRTLAHVDGEVGLELNGKLTQRSLLDAVEAQYPMLRGTMRDHVTQVRRPMVRFFACGEDLSHESLDAPLPDSIANGVEPFLIIGAIAGGEIVSMICRAGPVRCAPKIASLDCIGRAQPICSAACLQKRMQFGRRK